MAGDLCKREESVALCLESLCFDVECLSRHVQQMVLSGLTVGRGNVGGVGKRVDTDRSWCRCWK